MINYYIKVLKQYTDFKGRARRKEYWLFVLTNALISSLLNFLFGAENFISLVYTILVILPSLAVSVRRLHDTGKSGLWYFLIFLPVIGWIWIFILFISDSQQGSNKYGPDPKFKERQNGDDILI